MSYPPIPEPDPSSNPPEYGGQQQPPHGDQPPYGSPPPHGDQPPYGSPPPHGDQPSPYGSPAQPPYGDQPSPYGSPAQPPYGDQPVYGQQQQYPYPQPYPTGYQKTNTMAILALLFAFIFSPLGIVFGHIAKKQINRSGEQGSGLATAGLILGYIFTGLYLLACCGGLVALAIASGSGNST